jgi:hypothetical protein
LGILLTLAVFLVIVALITTSEAELSSIRHQLLTAGLDLRATETQLGHAKSELDNANKELSLKTAALTQLSSDAAKNSEFVVFLHYRPKVSYSKSFAEAARQALVNAGFRVPPAGGNGPNVHDQPTDAAEGPHVDWFQKPGAVEAESEASRQAAERVAAILNGFIHPAPLALLTLKPSGWPTGASADQNRYIGVWF